MYVCAVRSAGGSKWHGCGCGWMRLSVLTFVQPSSAARPAKNARSPLLPPKKERSSPFQEEKRSSIVLEPQSSLLLYPRASHPPGPILQFYKTLDPSRFLPDPTSLHESDLRYRYFLEQRGQSNAEILTGSAVYEVQCCGPNSSLSRYANEP